MVYLGAILATLRSWYHVPSEPAPNSLATE
jgi:hypothetical protein